MYNFWWFYPLHNNFVDWFWVKIFIIRMYAYAYIYNIYMYVYIFCYHKPCYSSKHIFVATGHKKKK